MTMVLRAAGEKRFGRNGGADLKGHEHADLFDPDELGVDRERIAEARGPEVVDLRAGDHGDEAGAAHLLERPAERRGQLRARDFHHAQVGDVMDHAARRRCRSSRPRAARTKCGVRGKGHGKLKGKKQVMKWTRMLGRGIIRSRDPALPMGFGVKGSGCRGGEFPKHPSGRLMLG